jgi:hypothetical protein
MKGSGSSGIKEVELNDVSNICPVYPAIDGSALFCTKNGGLSEPKDCQFAEGRGGDPANHYVYVCKSQNRREIYDKYGV